MIVLHRRLAMVVVLIAGQEINHLFHFILFKESGGFLKMTQRYK